ncbi:MAG: tetratricopeptide repeat protein [Anaerolineales bacterium]|jgi:tetratricopeptide (TPR) repeat protein
MTERQEHFEESMRLGHSAAWDLEWDKAIGFYRKALALSPDHPGALTSLGLALLEAEQYQEALKIYQHAGKLSPENPIPIEKISEILERLGKIADAVARRKAAADLHIKQHNAERAIDNWAHIARLKPADRSSRAKLAEVYDRLGRKREAVYEYLALASILQKEGKVDRAVEAVQRALRVIPGEKDAAQALKQLQKGTKLPDPLEPRGSTAPLRMAEVREFLKSEDDDEIEVEDSQQADPEAVAQSRALTILAGLVFDEQSDDEDDSAPVELSDLTEGRISQERKQIGQPRMLHYLGQAIDLQTRGNKRQAISEYERAIQAGLDHPAIHYNLGILLKNLDDQDEAFKHLTKSLGHPELDLGANLALGRLARIKGDLPEAARYLLQALHKADSLSIDESQSSQLTQLYDTILASLNEGDEDSLSKIVENTLNFLSGPEWLERLRQARRSLETGAEGAALVPIADMLAVGGTEKVLKSIGRIDDLMNRGLNIVALEESMLAMDYVPSYLGLHFRIAEILIQRGNTPAGMTKLRTIARTHKVRGEIPQATQIFNRIIRHSPIDISARKQLIQLLAQQDRAEEALEQYIELADLYRQMAEIDNARITLQEAVALTQRSAVDRQWHIRLLNRIGDIDLSHLDWREALRAFEEICELDPENESARLQVIDLNLRLGQEKQAGNALDRQLEYLVQTEQSKEALALLEDLAREYPGKQILHSRLAQAYGAAGRKADAIAQYDALGEIQLDAGQTKEAARTIETIINLEPPNIEGYEELLRNIQTEE